MIPRWIWFFLPVLFLPTPASALVQDDDALAAQRAQQARRNNPDADNGSGAAGDSRQKHRGNVQIPRRPKQVSGNSTNHLDRIPGSASRISTSHSEIPGCDGRISRCGRPARQAREASQKYFNADRRDASVPEPGENETSAAGPFGIQGFHAA